MASAGPVINDSAELVKNLEDLVECPVCLDPLEDPRALPCQHSFCFKCLEGIMQDRCTVRCPCCNQEATFANGLDGLPCDFRANKWLDILTDYRKARVSRDEAPPKRETASTTPAEVSSTTLKENPEDSPTCCPVCENTPTTPLALSCHHVLCENCAGFLLPVGGTQLHCPTCAAPTTIGEKDEVEDSDDSEQSILRILVSLMGALQEVTIEERQEKQERQERRKSCPPLAVCTDHVYESVPPPPQPPPLPSVAASPPSTSVKTPPKILPKPKSVRTSPGPMQAEVTLSDIVETRKSLKKTSHARVDY